MITLFFFCSVGVCESELVTETLVEERLLDTNTQTMDDSELSDHEVSSSSIVDMVVLLLLTVHFFWV